MAKSASFLQSDPIKDKKNELCAWKCLSRQPWSRGNAVNLSSSTPKKLVLHLLLAGSDCRQGADLAMVEIAMNHPACWN